MQANDLAIILTKEIMKDLMKSNFMGNTATVSKEPEVSSVIESTPPNFYVVREKILKTISKYIDVLSIQTDFSPETLDQMRPDMRKDYMSDLVKREACTVVESIINSKDHWDRLNYEDTKYRFSECKYIAVLKTGLINKDSNNVKL